MENEENNEQEGVDALCRECGHAFKAFVDRMIPADKEVEENQPIACPVCGCGDCNIGK